MAQADQIADLTRRLEIRSKRNQELQSKLDRVSQNSNESISRLEAELQVRIDKIKRLDAYYDGECKRLVSELNEALGRISTLEAEVSELRRRLEVNSKRMQEVTQQAQSFRSTFKGLRDARIELASKLKETERRRATSAKSAGEWAHKAQMAEKRVLHYKSRCEENNLNQDGKRSEEQEA